MVKSAPANIAVPRHGGELDHVAVDLDEALVRHVNLIVQASYHAVEGVEVVVFFLHLAEKEPCAQHINLRHMRLVVAPIRFSASHARAIEVLHEMPDEKC